MSTLVLAIDAPQQSWGQSSRANVRHSGIFPTKSGIVGLIASAMGRDWEDDICDLAALKFGVRIDYPGTVMRDFHTAQGEKDKKDGSTLTYRYYLVDAKFTVALEGEDSLIEDIEKALQKPRRAIFFGRKSCPPARPLVQYISNKSFEACLHEAELLGSPSDYQRLESSNRLEIITDCRDDETPHEFIMDYPVTFSRTGRQFKNRPVRYSHVTVHNDTHPHDPFTLLGGN